MKRISTKKELIKVCSDNNIELNRWEKGTPHHIKSILIMDALEAIDTALFDMCLDWKTGGDGDNGETLMYQLDIVFELEDKGYTVSKDAWR